MKPMLFAGIAFLLYCPILCSQNLINNPSFDEVRPYSHSDNHSQLRKHFNDNARFWNTPSGGTPDIIMNKYREEAKYDRGLGPTKPRTGESMIGIRVFGCYEGATSHCREYIQTKTKETLLEGKCYEYEYYAQTHYRSVRNNGLGIGFTEYGINDMTQISIVDVEEVIIEEEIVDEGIGKWVKISGSIKPKKNYNHIIIGNYYLDEDTRTKKVENGSPYGYYYIDDIGLYKVDCGTGKRDTEKRSFVLNNISFDVNDHQLDKINKQELLQIYKQIESTPYSSITIKGYTDNTGTDAYNLKLSQKRANSVLETLQILGISPSKLNAVGYGNSNPLDMVNIANNRRVEIIVE